MNILKKAYCRIYQAAFRAAIPLLPYREPQILHSCRELPEALSGNSINNLMIVTDNGIVKFGLAAKVTAVLDEAGISYCVYDKTCPNPTVKNVEAALKLYKEHGCQALIAIGGGSAMDCAKAVGARVAYPGKTLNQLKGTLHVLRKIPLLIAIPTTAGTGSENTLAAVITDPDQKYKYVLNDFVLIPRYAVLDASMTYSLPPSLTATTGMDALTHAVEAYIGRSTTKETRQMALSATKLIFANIERAYENGSDEEARSNMLLASYRAGFAFSRSYVGYIHAVAHSLGGQYNVPHGLANAVIMPYVLDAYGSGVYKKLQQMGCAAGVCTEEDSPEEGAKKFIVAIRSLNERMQIPTYIEGIQESDIPVMAAHAEKEANPLYPVPKLMTEKELENFYRVLQPAKNI